MSAPDTILEHGFLLTRNQFDRNGKCVFEFWFKTGKDPIQVIVNDAQPVCFITQKQMSKLESVLSYEGISLHYKPVSLKTFSGEPCTALYSDSLRDYYQLKELATNTGVELLEHDIRPVDRFLMERFIYDSADITGLKTTYTKYSQITNAKLKSSNFVGQYVISSLDIECDETGYIYSIGVDTNTEKDEQRVFYNGYNIKKPSSSESYLVWCQSESEALQKFAEYMMTIDPDLIIGWNVVQFDINVLLRAFKRNQLRWNFGRDGSEVIFRSGRDNEKQAYPDKVYVAGRVVLDGIEVMKNATYHFDSFSLNYVAQAILGDKKLISASESDTKLAQIKHQYINQPLKLAAYNLKDCVLVSQIFTKERLIDYLVTRARLTGLELNRVGGSVAAFTNLYLPRAHRKGYVAPNLVSDKDYVNSPGGYVMDSMPGLHQHVLVFDFKSLYPSIIRTFGIDPISLIEGLTLPEEHCIPGYRGGRFSREPGILVDILEQLWLERDQAKREKNQIWSNAIKIMMNSFYGVLGSAGCRFYDTRLASSITMRGHWIMNETKQWFEQQGLTVIYGDTDSIFVKIVNSDTIETDAVTLQEALNAWWSIKLLREYNIESKLEIEFETYFNPFFMPTLRGTESGSKKRYAGMKRNNKSTELIIKGLETVRSDWTELAKQFQVQLFNHVFTGRSCKKLIESTLYDLNSGKLDECLFYKKRIKNQLDKYTKTTPPQIRAARLANQYLNRTKYKRGIKIHYYISIDGPVTTDMPVKPIDYQHYIEKQLRPIAEAILVHFEPELLTLFDKQIRLI